MKQKKINKGPKHTIKSNGRLFQSTKRIYMKPEVTGMSRVCVTELFSGFKMCFIVRL